MNLNKNTIIERMSNKYNLAAITIAMLMIIPYLFAWFMTPEGMSYLWFNFDNQDNASYMTKMIVSQEGWTFLNQYSYLDNYGGYIFTFYILLGKISNCLDIPYLFVFHGARIILVFIFMRVLYLFLTLFIRNDRLKFFLFILIPLGGGNEFIIGVASLLTIQDSYRGVLDVAYFPHSSMLFVPHLILIMISQIRLWHLSTEYSKRPIKISLKIGIYLLLISAIHPYTAVIEGVIIALYILFKLYRKGILVISKVLPISLFGIIPFPYLLYILYAFAHYPTLIEWQKQAIVPFHSFTILVSNLSVSLVLIVFVLFTKWAWSKERFILSFWVLCTILVAFIPVYFQSRLWDGIGIPLLILVGWYVFEFIKVRLIKLLIVSLLLGNSMWFIFEPFFFADEHLTRYMYKENMEAYNWIKENGELNDIVMSDYMNGNLLTYLGEVRVVLGHDHESPKFKENHSKWDKFCKGDNQQGSEYFKQINAKYVFVDSRMCENAEILEWTVVFRNETISIYEVN